MQIDLGEMCTLHAILMWHDYYRRGTVFNGVVVQIADDAEFTTNVRTLFNNDHANAVGLGEGRDKLYMETHEGKLIEAKGVPARYVRCYSNGNDKNAHNSYTEIEVWGLAGK